MVLIILKISSEDSMQRKPEASNKVPSNETKKPDTVKITKIFEFAGEEVR